MSCAIVIAVFNGAATLERALDSLASQTLPADEVIVIDGGSTDGTQAILARRGDVVTDWRSEADRGIYDAWSKALKLVTADWVVFLGADDRLHDSQVLAGMAAVAATAPPEAPFIYGRLHEVDSTGSVVGECGVPWVRCRNGFFYQMNLPHPGMWHRRRICFAGSGFDSSYRIAGDYAKLRPLLLRHPPVFVDMVVADAQEGGVSTHPNRRVESVLEVGRAVLDGGDARPLGWHWMLLKNRMRRGIWLFFGESVLHRARKIARAARGR